MAQVILAGFGIVLAAICVGLFVRDGSPLIAALAVVNIGFALINLAGYVGASR